MNEDSSSFELISDIEAIEIIAVGNAIRELQRSVTCLKNDGYLASLEVRKIYQTLPDGQAASHHLLRVIDESGEDHLYPEEYFVTINLPQVAVQAFNLVEAEQHA